MSLTAVIVLAAILVVGFLLLLTDRNKKTGQSRAQDVIDDLQGNTDHAIDYDENDGGSHVAGRPQA